MDMDYNNVTIVELRAHARARGARGCTGFRKAGFNAFFPDNAMPGRPVRPGNVHYDSLRMVELTTLARERGLRGYSRIRKVGLIALLRENEPVPAPSVNPRPKPPRPTRPPPPPLEDCFASYELERAFRGGGGGGYRSFRINGRSRMDVESFFGETRGSVVNLTVRELPGGALYS